MDLTILQGSFDWDMVVADSFRRESFLPALVHKIPIVLPMYIQKCAEEVSVQFEYL